VSVLPTVFVVDDDPAILRAVSRLLNTAGYKVRTYPTSHALLEDHDAEIPGCLVLDVALPGLNGLQLQEVLNAAGCERFIVFITGYGDVPSSVLAMKAGAVDFLTKPFDDEPLLAAVDMAIEKDRAAREARSELLSIQSRLATLTQREREVLQRVVIGRLNKQIAADLGIVEKTIKVHRHRVMEKMGADSLAELVRMAERAGIGAPDKRRLTIAPARDSRVSATSDPLLD
jgi:FixJ family two-component response regulator